MRRAVERAFVDHEASRIPDDDCDVRAAVALILSPSPALKGQMEALFVRRAEVEGDPWSGHVALPGGRMDEADADLLDTARRETCEETALELRRTDIVGRLDEIHPRSRHLPSVAVTPYVAWTDRPVSLRLNHELSGFLWIPVPELNSKRNQGTLMMDRVEPRAFPTIEFEGHTIWGMTWLIVRDFLSVLERQKVG